VGLSEIGAEQAEEMAAILDEWQETGRVDSPFWLPASAFPRDAYGGLPDELHQLTRRAHGPGGDIGTAMQEALTLARRLETHLHGDLEPYTAEQHRRAVHGLTQRLTTQLQLWDTAKDDP
jgi:hypothetical protein